MVKTFDINKIQNLLGLRQILEDRLKNIKARVEHANYAGLNVDFGSADPIMCLIDSIPDYHEREETRDKAARAIAEICEWFLGVELAAVNASLKELGLED